MRKQMFYGAGPLIFENAKRLRNNQTHAELVLWGYLKQHPLGIFIADFYCHSLKLVIELDGSIHNKEDVREYDIYRQKLIEEDGIKVLRFSNDDVEKRIEMVLMQIEQFINQHGKPL